MAPLTRWTGYGLVLLAALAGLALATRPPVTGSPAVLAVVLLGAAGYLLCCHEPAELRSLVHHPPGLAPAAVRERLLHYARIARAEGWRRLADLAEAGPHDPLEQAGRQLVADGATAWDLTQALGPLAAQLELAAWQPVEVWATAARGTVHAGALLSLAQMNWALLALPAEQTTMAVAASLSATFFGLTLAWLIAQPALVRARRAARQKALAQQLWLTGWPAIAAGEHPLQLAERLAAARAA